MTVHTQRQGWFRFHQYHLQKCWSTGDIFLQQELSMKIMLRQFVEVNEASNATFYLYDNKWCKQQITIPHGQPPKELELFLIFKEMHNFCLTFCTSGWKLPINQYYQYYNITDLEKFEWQSHCDWLCKCWTMVSGHRMSVMVRAKATNGQWSSDECYAYS